MWRSTCFEDTPPKTDDYSAQNKPLHWLRHVRVASISSHSYTGSH